MPAAVQAWRAELQAKNRTKLAAAVADPASNPEMFEEGWEEALQREAAAPAPGAPLVNGGSGELRFAYAGVHRRSQSGAGESEDDDDEEEEDE